MASKSLQPEPEKKEVIEEALDVLDKALDRVKVLYEQYFLGIQKQPPTYLHTDIERKIRDLSQLQIRNTALRYRFLTLQQKFASYNTYWRRTNRQIESGKYVRNLSKIGRQAAKSGEEVPEEILAAMPKRMRDQVRRDREVAVATARRREHNDDFAEEEYLTLAPLPDAVPIEDASDEITGVRHPASLARVPRGPHVIDESDGDLDIDTLFGAVTNEAADDATESGPPPQAMQAPTRPTPAPPPRPSGLRPGQSTPVSGIPVQAPPPPRPAVPAAGVPRPSTQPGAGQLRPPAPAALRPPVPPTATEPAVRPTPLPAGSSTGQPAVRPTPLPAGSSAGQPAVRPTPLPAGSSAGQPAVGPLPAGSSAGQPAVRPTPLPAGSSAGQPADRPTAPLGSSTGQSSVRPTPPHVGSQPAVPDNSPPAVRPSVPRPSQPLAVVTPPNMPVPRPGPGQPHPISGLVTPPGTPRPHAAVVTPPTGLPRATPKIPDIPPIGPRAQPRIPEIPGPPRSPPLAAPPPEVQASKPEPAPVPKPLAPSQITRPNPIVAGASLDKSVSVETMSGPFPRAPSAPVIPRTETPVPHTQTPVPPRTQTPVPLRTQTPVPPRTQTPAPPRTQTPPPRPPERLDTDVDPAGAKPLPPVRPPAGMTDADVNALYAKYVKAKEMVGETAGPGAYGKLLKTIHQQAPKIMEQYKSKGVDFSVVVKDNQVIIRAKPKP